MIKNMIAVVSTENAPRILDTHSRLAAEVFGFDRVFHQIIGDDTVCCVLVEGTQPNPTPSSVPSPSVLQKWDAMASGNPFAAFA